MHLELKVEQLEERHIEPHVRLSQSEYGEHAPVSNAAHLRWKYLQNPQGQSIGIHLYAGTELVGRAIALSRAFYRGGALSRAAHVVDLLVRSDFRGMAALIQLMRGLKQLEGFDFYLVMSPNPAGAAVWEKLWKMEACFELDASVVPLRPFNALHSLKGLPNHTIATVLDAPWRTLIGTSGRIATALSSVELEDAWPSTSELDELFFEGSKGRAVGDRSGQYIQWRYQNSPVFEYQPLAIRRKGRLKGYLVTRRTDFGNLDCTFIVDAFAIAEDPGIVRTASLHALWQAQKQGTQAALFIGNAGLEPLSQLARLPFLKVPASRLPRRLTVFAEWIGDPKFSIRREQFYLGLGDSDVV